jgi:chemotaxis protein histidine kinase CheA
MTPDAWPSPDAPPAALPRIEDLPIADQGYDQEAVRVAFDSFYRHAAQLDASLRTLEAVETFRRDADALRNDLRALRALGLGGGSEPSWATADYGRPRAEIPGVVFRLAAEAALIVAVAVIVGVAHLQTSVVVALMAAALAVVVIAEWLASRARFVPPAVAFLPPVETAAPAADEPAPYVEAPVPVAAVGWGPPQLEAVEDTEADDALTVIEPPEAEAAEAEDAEAPDAEPEAEAAEEVEAEPDETAAEEPEEHAAEVEAAGAAADEEAAEPDAAAEDVEAAEDAEEPDEAPDPWEQAPLGVGEEPEPELVERGGLFRRRRR